MLLRPPYLALCLSHSTSAPFNFFKMHLPNLKPCFIKSQIRLNKYYSKIIFALCVLNLRFEVTHLLFKCRSSAFVYFKSCSINVSNIIPPLELQIKADCLHSHLNISFHIQLNNCMEPNITVLYNHLWRQMNLLLTAAPQIYCKTFKIVLLHYVKVQIPELLQEFSS